MAIREDYTATKLFGCSLRNISSQLGIGSSPSTLTVQLIRRPGDTFTLRDVGGFVTIEIGAFHFIGIVESFEARDDTGGFGQYTVQISDVKSVFDNVQIFLNGTPLNKDASDGVAENSAGRNIIFVAPEVTTDIDNGIRCGTIARIIESAKIYHRDFGITVSIDPLVSAIRGDYRIRGSALSLAALINQTATDHGLEWYIESVGSSAVVRLIPQRIVNTPVGGVVVSRAVGCELVRTNGTSAIVGSNKETLEWVSATRIKPFWGVDLQGNILDQPTFWITLQNGQREKRVTSEAEMRGIINGTITQEDVGPDYYYLIKRYAEAFWGRKFYFPILSSQYDSTGEPWIDTSRAGFWEEPDGKATPDNFGNEGVERFCTDDGRYVSFVKLPNPAKRVVRVGENYLISWWDNKLRQNSSVLVNSYGQWYMSCSTERYRKYIIITLPTQMLATRIDNPGTDAQVEGVDVITQLGALWLPIVHMTDTYGPWVLGAGVGGYADMVVDGSINPWNFGYRGMRWDEARAKMSEVAMSKLRAGQMNTNRSSTAELTVTGLPTQGLGGVFDTNFITSISIQFSTGGVQTTYRSKREPYRPLDNTQRLVDELRRKQDRMNNPLYNSPNFPGLERELNNHDQDLYGGAGDTPGGNIPSSAPASSVDQTFTARVVENAHMGLMGTRTNIYKVVRQKAVVVNNAVRYEDATILFIYATNISEKDDRAGRVQPGILVEITTPAGQTSAHFFSSPATPPTSVMGTIMALTGVRTYRITPDIYDPRLTSQERTALDTVYNNGEPTNCPGLLEPGTRVEINWVSNEDGTLTPFINGPVQVFGAPGSGG